MVKKVAVVGSGFGGLSAAALLAKKGCKVTLFEKNPLLGGRATVHREQGYMFDRGPSWYLMPEVFDRFFSELGKKTGDYLNLKRLDPMYKVFYEAEGELEVPANPKEIRELFGKLEGNGAEKLEKYLKQAQYKYDVAVKDFLYKDFYSVFDFFSPKIALEGTKLHMFESVDKYARRFFSSDKARKILEYTMVFLGGSPDNTPALYSIMSHVDLTLGVWYPIGGMVEIVNAMEKVCRELGIDIRKDEGVERIIVYDKNAKGVVTEKGEQEFDAVVVNADYAYAEMELLEKSAQSFDEKYWENRVMAPSALLFFLGVKGKVEGLQHHNLFLAKDWNSHFDDIFKDKKWPDNPSYYVCCPSKTDESVAPKGNENLFFLVPVAEGLKDGDVIREKMYEQVMSDFERRIGRRIRDKVEVKVLFSHRDFKREYNAYKGTALGLAHTLFQTAVFRLPHKSKKVKNLFYTGHYNHPGVGVPMVIISSHIVTEEVLKEHD